MCGRKDICIHNMSYLRCGWRGREGGSEGKTMEATFLLRTQANIHVHVSTYTCIMYVRMAMTQLQITYMHGYMYILEVKVSTQIHMYTYIHVHTHTHTHTHTHKWCNTAPVMVIMGRCDGCATQHPVTLHCAGMHGRVQQTPCAKLR